MKAAGENAKDRAETFHRAQRKTVLPARGPRKPVGLESVTEPKCREVASHGRWKSRADKYRTQARELRIAAQAMWEYEGRVWLLGIAEDCLRMAEEAEKAGR
jgi:hypothetical protein